MNRKVIGLISALYFGLTTAGTIPVVPVKTTQSSFQVELPANPSTGYQWALQTYDKDLLTLTGSHYVGKKTHLMGAGGVMVFNFKCNEKMSRPAHTTLLFTYARSWEKAAVKTSKVEIVFEK